MELMAKGKKVTCQNLEHLDTYLFVEGKGGLTRRQGHTELAVGLARLSNVSPVVIGAEMLQPDGDLALSVEAAKKWASDRGIPFLEGADIIQALNN